MHISSCAQTTNNCYEFRNTFFDIESVILISKSVQFKVVDFCWLKRLLCTIRKKPQWLVLQKEWHIKGVLIKLIINNLHKKACNIIRAAVIRVHMKCKMTRFQVRGSFAAIFIVACSCSIMLIWGMSQMQIPAKYTFISNLYAWCAHCINLQKMELWCYVFKSH